MKNEFIEAGRITNTHGVAGEVKIEVWLDSPEYLKKFKRVYVDGNEMRLLSAKVQKSFIIALLEGYTDINSAMQLKGKTVYIARRDAGLRRGEYFVADIIGAEVFDEAGVLIGTLTEVMEKPAANIYVVKGESEHLIPAVPEFIRSVDADRGRITVRLIEGM